MHILLGYEFAVPGREALTPGRVGKALSLELCLSEKQVGD